MKDLFVGGDPPSCHSGPFRPAPKPLDPNLGPRSGTAKSSPHYPRFSEGGVRSHRGTWGGGGYLTLILTRLGPKVTPPPPLPSCLPSHRSEDRGKVETTTSICKLFNTLLFRCQIFILFCIGFSYKILKADPVRTVRGRPSSSRPGPVPSPLPPRERDSGVGVGGGTGVRRSSSVSTERRGPSCDRGS